MGIRFLDSILSLLTAAAGVFAAYLVGHGLSTGHSLPWIAAAVLAVLALALGFISVRRIRRYGQQHPR